MNSYSLTKNGTLGFELRVWETTSFWPPKLAWLKRINRKNVDRRFFFDKTKKIN